VAALPVPPRAKPPDVAVAPPLSELPSADRQDVGEYVHPKGPPSILVERRRGPERWARLRPGQRLYTAGHLVSLPGYRSRLRLDRGAELELWGNVPEFSSFPPILETTIMLNVPEAGIDLDFTLERGRVRLANVKAEAPVRVRLRFQRLVWDLTLPDARTEVMVEHWGSWPREEPYRREGDGPGPERCVAIYVRGRAKLAVGTRTLSLDNLTRFTWTTRGGAAVTAETLAKLPDWWTDRIVPDNPRRADMMLALQDYDALLTPNASVLDVAATQVRESPSTAHRLLGVLFLGALEAAPALIDCLEDRNHSDVRGATAFVLRQWIARGRSDERTLHATLCDRKLFPPEKADIVLGLLHSFSREDVARPQTYDRLVGYLNHDNLAVRDLALWHLALLTPDIARDITYRPTDPPEARAAAVAQWRKRLAAGKGSK
jgi:hypothetical protein